MEGTTVSASALAFAEFRLQGGGHGEEGSDGVMDSRSPPRGCYCAAGLPGSMQGAAEREAGLLHS